MSIIWGRASKHHALVERRAALIKRVQAWKDAGYSNAQIAEELEINESTVRVLLFGK